MYLFKGNLTIMTKVINSQWGNLANTTLKDEVSGHICPLSNSLKGIQDRNCGTVKNAELWAPHARLCLSAKDTVNWSGG